MRVNAVRILSRACILDPRRANSDSCESICRSHAYTQETVVEEKMRVWLRILMMTLLLGFGASSLAHSSSIRWQTWSDALFERAKREDKFILLDLEAVWCHWCHVMDRETYGNPEVMHLIESRYIPVKVGQDARPDLSRRYEDYGWPATVVFNAEGEEIAKLRGYIPPPRMIAILKEIIDDPSPVIYPDSRRNRLAGSDFATSALLSGAIEKALSERYLKSHDYKLGGFNGPHKFLDRDTTEYALARARQGDATSRKIARQNLDGALNLFDPAWGGVYQYSTHGDWKHVHFEKLVQMQAEYMRLYALGYRVFENPAYLKAAKEIHRYVKAFLTSPEGAFYVSQDADLVKGRHSEDYFKLSDSERRKRGIPQVDQHVYARENGWMIAGLAQLYMAAEEPRYLEDAERAARWIIDNRALPGGGFRHDAHDSAGPYLEDTLAMGRALLALYTATAERDWLARAEATANFIALNFSDPGAPGFMSTAHRGALKPRANIDENLALARFANSLSRYTGKTEYRELAEHAMRYLVTEQIALSRPSETGILLAAGELANDPLHITVVGRKSDPNARALFSSALHFPGVYRRIEWWDRQEGPMPNADVQYPEFEQAAAFFCANGRCSLPIFKPGEIAQVGARLTR
jgi:uncharacterized protein